MKKPTYIPIPMTQHPQATDPFDTDACLNLSILRGYHHRMDLINFTTYFIALCDFIERAGFKFNSELRYWYQHHKRFDVFELSEYFMTEYYNKKFSLN